MGLPMAESRELSRGNHLCEPAGLPWLSLPGLANPTESPSPAGFFYQSEPEEMDGENVPEGPPLPALAVRKLVSFTVKAIDLLPPSGQPSIMLLPGSGSCVFHQYVSFRPFIYGIKEELS